MNSHAYNPSQPGSHVVWIKPCQSVISSQADCTKKHIMQISISDHFLPFFREGGNNTTFMCEICAKNFGMKHNLEQHVKTVHGTAALQCEHCNRAFKRKFSLTRHLKTCRPQVEEWVMINIVHLQSSKNYLPWSLSYIYSFCLKSDLWVDLKKIGDCKWDGFLLLG